MASDLNQSFIPLRNLHIPFAHALNLELNSSKGAVVPLVLVVTKSQHTVAVKPKSER